MKLLIVDDEPRTVRGLRKNVDWAALGVTSIQDASSGIAALRAMAQDPADILLADIGMPLMDGIELAQRVKEEYPNTRVVFVTGHADVNYMKSAFKSAAVDYLLKPINVEELSQTVRRVVEDLRHEGKQNAYLARVEAQLHQSLPALREKFFLSLLGGPPVGSQAVQEKLAFLQLDIPPQAVYTTLVITEDGFGEQGEEWRVDHNLLAVAVANIAEWKLAPLPMGYCFEQPDNSYVCVLALLPAGEDKLEEWEASTEERLEALSCEIQAALLEALDMQTSVGVGVWVESLSKLSLTYESARQAAARRLVLGAGQVILGSNTGIHKEPYAKVDFTYYSNIYTAVVNGDEAGALEIAREIFGLIHDEKIARPLRVSNIGSLMVLAVGSAVQESIEYSLSDLEHGERVDAEVRAAGTLDDKERLMRDYISWAVNRIQSVSTETQVSVVDMVKALIEQHYAEEISLRTLSKAVYLSPAYLCLLFKQETGTTLVNYISSLRVEKAKSMLMNPNRTLTAVSQEVGFNDPKYFSRVFKRYTGVKPSEYRSHALGEASME